MITVNNQYFFTAVQQQLAAGKQVAITVKGHSMRPFIKNGQQVTLAPAGNYSLRPGMVVLAYINNIYVLHRVIKTGSAGVVLAGDGNLWQTETAKLSNILAVAIAVKRGSRQVCLHSNTEKLKALLWRMARPGRWLAIKLAGNK